MKHGSMLNLVYMTTLSFSLHGMDNNRDKEAFQSHKQKFLPVLRAVQLAKNIKAGSYLPNKEVTGLFGNGMSVPVNIYYDEHLYEEVPPFAEIPLYSEKKFVVEISNTKHRLSLPAQEKYFYYWISQRENKEFDILGYATLQNLDLGKSTINAVTGQSKHMNEKVLAVFAKKLAQIKAYNSWKQ